MTHSGSISTRWLKLVTAFAATLLLPASFAQAPQRLLTRHTRDVVLNGRAPRVGELPSDRVLKLAIMLPLRNRAALNTLLSDLHNPQSSSYLHYLSVEQFTNQFGPTQADVNAVVQFAQANGMTVTRTTPNRMVVDVNASVASIEKAFHVTMGVYQHPTENRTFYAIDREPTADLSVQLWHITGLDDYSPPRPMLRFAPKGAVRTEQTGSGPDGQFLGSDMRAAYYGGTALTGAGQTIGIFGLNFNMSDVEAYFSSIGQAFNPGVVITDSIDGYDTSCPNPCNDGEPIADIVQSYSMAPGVNAVIEYEASNDVDTFTQMATDDIAKQLSASVGWLPADPTSDEPIFMEFAAQGQNLFVASDDSGAWSPTNPAYYPADDPYVTAVGGTQLTTTGAGGAWASEVAWGFAPGITMACGSPGGSGGGYSTNGFAIPSYQQLPGVINSSNAGSPTLRNGPDVSADADCNSWWCAGGTCQGGLGGTSLSTPRWAGFMALVNEQAATANAPSAGFLNPLFYSIGTSSSYGSNFHDITSGGEYNSTPCTASTSAANCLTSGTGSGYEGYDAVTGYDLATGWGSPNGQALINSLTPAATAPYFAIAASPSTLSIPPGSSEATSTIQLSSGNGFSGTVNLSVNILGSPSGVTASLSPTSISGSDTSMLTVSLRGTGPGGTFVVAVTGASAGGVETQPAYLTLALPTFGLAASPSAVYLNQSSSATSTLTVTPQNGFDGKVSFSSVQGLPSGVTASIDPAETDSTSTLKVTARSTTPTGSSVPLTFNATSGDIVQSASSLTLAVSAATGTGGIGSPVSLASAYNTYAIYTDGTTITTSGLDGLGDAYSANLLTPHRILNDVQFNFGPANKLDAVSGAGQTVALPPGQYATLQLLGTGYNGDQSAQTVTVTYTDGTTSTFTQSFSDWYVPQYNNNESFAVVMPYRDLADGTKDNRVFNLYAYIFPLDSRKAVKSFALPDDPNVVVLAATLTGQTVQDSANLSRLFNTGGIFNNGVTFSATGGLDGGGDGCTLPDGCADAYSAQQLGLSSGPLPHLIVNGALFGFGPINTADCTTNCVPDAISLPGAPGATLRLPFDQQRPYTTMTLLGTGVQGSHTGTVTVNYTNGTSETFNQTFSDWCNFGANVNESIAVNGINRINSDGTLNGATCNLYSYTYALDPHRVVRSVTLTNTDETSFSFVLSVTLQAADWEIWPGNHR
ncbi:MAG TPA: S53 family peptidase [Acidobacteriaceae bacterium]|nr:S53 family peptidase [Acidobacteriaceae bacterium]